MENTQQQRYTLAGVLWFKFLRWADGTTAKHMFHRLLTFLAFLAVVAAIVAPSFVLGTLTATFISSKSVAVIGVCLLYFYGKSLARIARKGAAKARRGNQHTWEGVPVPELCDYLLRVQAFPTAAIKSLGLSQKQWRRMAKALEGRGILKRGINNSRVLREISREQLAQQLQNDFPLVWNEEKGWVLRNGPWRTWLGDEEKREQEHRASVEKLEKKKEKLRREINELSPAPFTRRVVSGVL